MWFDIILFIAFLIFAIFQAIFIIILPLGTEETTFRRLPWVTFTVMGINVIVYFLLLPTTVQQDKNYEKSFVELYTYIEKNEQILADEKVRNKLKEFPAFKPSVEIVEEQLKNDPQTQEDYKAWLRTGDAEKMRTELEKKIAKLKEAEEAMVVMKYGLAGPGRWKAYQFITYAFLHDNARMFGFVFPLHLFLNLLALFAIGMVLEDLWGRGTFLVFYLLGAVAAGIPEAMSNPGVLIGASGAIAATMGAFLVRLPHTKLKIGWLLNPFALPILFLRLMLGRKPWGLVRLKGYFYLAYWIINQLLLSWFINYKLGGTDGVSYKCHIGGFLFGAAFAYAVKVTQFEEKHINPKIEAKVSFSTSPGIAQALEMLDKDEVAFAERKLKSELMKAPDDPNVMMALIQVYQRSANYDQINAVYAKLIRFHLSKHDKEAALYAYDSLLSAFPDDRVSPQIPIRDWLAICDYLKESNMIREAAVEYERLVTSYPNDPLTVSACVFGGEAALATHDNTRALRLFEKAEALHPPDGYASRVVKGLDNAKMRLTNRPNWVKQPPKTPFLAKDQ